MNVAKTATVVFSHAKFDQRQALPDVFRLFVCCCLILPASAGAAAAAAVACSVGAVGGEAAKYQPTHCKHRFCCASAAPVQLIAAADGRCWLLPSRTMWLC